MSTLLARHVTHMRAAGFSANTIHDRRRLLEVADRQLPYGIDTPATEELETFLANDDWGAWTRCTYYRHLAGFYKWACAGEQPHLNWNPLSTLTPPRNPQSDPNPVTDAELEHAIQASDERWQQMICLAAYAGLRASEVAGARREDVNDTTLTVCGKGNKTCKLPTHPEIWRRIGPQPPGLLFPNTTGGTMTRLPTAARKHFDRIGLPHVHLHMFRAWFGTMLLRGGADIRVVQALMRHASLQTTAGYLAVADEQRRFAVGTLPVLTTPLQDAA